MNKDNILDKINNDLKVLELSMKDNLIYKDYIIFEVITLGEAAKIYHRDRTSIRNKVINNLKEKIDYRRSGGTILVRKESLDSLYNIY